VYPKATLTQREVVARDKAGNRNPDFPHDGRCKSGHSVPPGTRFFHVSGPALPEEFWGVYCEPCLVVANKMARKQKQVT
jgi:hypothetical protein